MISKCKYIFVVRVIVIFGCYFTEVIQEVFFNFLEIDGTKANFI